MDRVPPGRQSRPTQTGISSTADERPSSEFNAFEIVDLHRAELEVVNENDDDLPVTAPEAIDPGVIYPPSIQSGTAARLRHVLELGGALAVLDQRCEVLGTATASHSPLLQRRRVPFDVAFLSLTGPRCQGVD